MKNISLFFLCAILTAYRIFAQPGFSSVTNLTSLPIVFNTSDNPQSKVWTYA
ncbi:hypothetical protein SAMN02745131_02474, partial [Flavisolibacter ginsengisoli DSM 18119]